MIEEYANWVFEQERNVNGARSLTPHLLVDGLYHVLSKGSKPEGIHLFNRTMNWHLKMHELYLLSGNLKIAEERWKRQLSHGLVILKINVIPGTHAGKLTGRQFIKVVAPELENVRRYMTHRIRAAPAAPVAVSPARELMRVLFTTELPLRRIPEILETTLSLNLRHWRNPDHVVGRALDLVMTNLDIRDPFVRLLITVGLILSSKNPLPAASDCVPNKKWGNNLKSNRGKWLCAMVFTGLWFGRSQVHLSNPDSPKFEEFNKSLLGNPSIVIG